MILQRFKNHAKRGFYADPSGHLYVFPDNNNRRPHHSLRRKIEMNRSCNCLSTNTLLLILFCVLLFIPPRSLAKDLETRHLFRIERSKNANIVQYDVQLTREGKIYSKEPVIAYWIRLAKDGQRKELSSTQKRWAYGFKAKYDAKGNFAILEMRAKIGRKIKVYEVDGAYYAQTRIDGQPAFIEKIHITTIEGGMIPKVQSIELYGKDTIKGEDRYENIKP